MKKLCLTVALAVLAFVGSTKAAHAGLVLEGSVGKGVTLTPDAGNALPTNIMVAPGLSLLGILRLQLGMVADLGDTKNSKFDLQLRPMIGFYPPLLPIYARAVFAVQNLLHDVKYGVGGAAGVKIGLPFIGLGVFAEAGIIPIFDVAGKTQTLLEGRLGAFWDF